jgi:hypothetical protein
MDRNYTNTTQDKNSAHHRVDSKAAPAETAQASMRKLSTSFNGALVPTASALLYIGYLGSGVVSTIYWSGWIAAALIILCSQWQFHSTLQLHAAKKNSPCCGSSVCCQYWLWPFIVFLAAT